MKPRIRKQFGRIVTETPYDRAWVNLVKDVVPSGAREYSPSHRVWVFDLPYYDFIRQTMVDFWGESIIDATGGDCGRQSQEWRKTYEAAKERAANDPRQETWTGGTKTDHHAVLGLLKTAEPEVVTAAYRALAKKYHPDTGGDAARMTAINEAYNAIKGKR